MKIAYTVWTWMMDPFNGFQKPAETERQKIEFEKALREISFLGYDAVENFNMIVDTFDGCVDELKEMLKRYNLEYACVYHYLKTDFEGEMKMAERAVKFLNALGCDIMNLQAPKHAPEGTTREDVLETARKANVMGKLCAENGVKLCVHPHWGSTVEQEHEIELFAANTDPANVKFCIDTAHTQLVGMDPIALAERLKDRLCYVHLKDVDPDVTISPERPMFRFRALGEGTVDFKGFTKKLREIGYDGVMCVELDYPKICNFQSAQTSRRYIHDVLGL